MDKLLGKQKGETKSEQLNDRSKFRMAGHSKTRSKSIDFSEQGLYWIDFIYPGITFKNIMLYSFYL